MELFKLFGSIMVDNKAANDSISKSEGLASKLGKGLSSGIKTAAKWGVALTGAAAAGGTALFGMAKNAADTGDRIDKLSQKIGMSRQGFQTWEYILSQNGTSIEVLQGGMKKLNKTMDDAKNGSKGAAESFARVGLSIDDIKNMNPEQAFEATVKALQAMPEGAEKAALANELLGRSGSELMPLLNGSAESVEALKQQAHDLGIVMSDDAVSASATFTDTLDNLQRSFGAVVAKIGVAVMPMMQQLADWIIANMPTIQLVMGKVFDFIKAAVEVAVNVFKNYLLPVFINVVNWVQTNWPTIQKVVGIVFDGVKKTIEVLVSVFNKYLMPVFQAIVKWVQDNWPTIQATISSVVNSIKSIISAVMAVIQTIWEKYGNQIKAFAEGVWNNIKIVIDVVMNSIQSIINIVMALIRGDWQGVWQGIKDYFTGIWDGMKRYVENITTTLKNVFGGAWDSIKEKTTQVWQGIKDAIMTPINWVKDKVKGVIDTIKGFFSFKITWPRIPMPHFGISPRGWKIGDLLKGSIPRLGINWYAKGGIFDSPTIFPTAHGLKGVGEAGPEAVTPIRALREYMIDSVDSMNKPTVQLLERVNKTLEAILEKNTDVVLDGRSMAKELIDPIDQLMATNHKRSRLGG